MGGRLRGRDGLLRVVEQLSGAVLPASAIESLVRAVLVAAPLMSVDYVEVVSTDDLRPVEEVQGEVLVAAAVWVGATRLIDNVVVESPPA